MTKKPFFDAVFMNSPTGIVLTDATGLLLDVNEACAVALGYSRSELIGKTFQELTYKDDVLPDMNMFNELLAGRMNAYDMTKRFVRKDGRTVWAQIKVNAVHEKDRTGYLVKHVVQIEPSGSSNLLVPDLLRDASIMMYAKIALGLLTFCTISSVFAVLHVIMSI